MSDKIRRDNQVIIKPARNAKGQLLPGNTANPFGRPVGKSLKEYQKAKFSNMTDAEKEEFLKTIPKEIIWKMAEGNPPLDVNLGGNTEFPFTIKIVQGNDSTTTRDSG